MPPELGKPTSNARSSSGGKNLGSEDSGPKKSNSETVFKECDALDEELAELKVAYEHYFLGNERLPPSRAHEDFKKRLMRLKSGMVRNTAAKFRLNSLHSKFLTYERLWQRTLQEIEAGTYKRDLLKAKRRTQKSGGDGARRQEAHELTEEISEEEIEEIAPIIPNEPKPVVATQPRFIPRPVDPEPVSVPFRPMPSAAVVPTVPTVPTVTPVAGASGMPLRGTPAPVMPSVPSVGPVVPPLAAKGSPPGGTPSKGTATIPPGATPSKGTATIPPGGTPSKGTPTIPPGGTPSKGTATIPPGGTPSKGTPVRGGSGFGAPSQGTSGIAAALESLTDEPLATPSPSASRPTSRPPSASAARPGAPSSPGSKPPGAAGAKPSNPSSPPKPAAASGSPGGLSDDKLKPVYDALVTAKRRNQEDTSNMNFDSVAANLRKQVPELLKQHNAKSVEFKVVIKDGKATLKAVPK
jgi:hypothetical protein